MDPEDAQNEPLFDVFATAHVRLHLVEGHRAFRTQLVIVDPTGVAPEIDIPADGASWQAIP